MAAAKDQETMPVLTVGNGNWGTVSLTSVQAVLNSASEELLDAFGRPPDASIRVGWWSQDPRVFDDHRPYEIRISARDTCWSQYVYQFSHELCHVMTNFDHCKKHRYKWFEESLCELASIFVLHRLAEAWAENPPPDIHGAGQFALNHRAYAEHHAGKYPTVPIGDLPWWLSRNIKALEEDCYMRCLNGVVAVSLLDQFRAEPSLWRDCVWLNHWNAGANETFSDYLKSWADCLHKHGREDRVPTVVRKLFLRDTPDQSRAK